MVKEEEEGSEGRKENEGRRASISHVISVISAPSSQHVSFPFAALLSGFFCLYFIYRQTARGLASRAPRARQRALGRAAAAAAATACAARARGAAAGAVFARRVRRGFGRASRTMLAAALAGRHAAAPSGGRGARSAAALLPARACR